MKKKVNRNLILSGLQKSYTDHLVNNLENINLKLIILNEVKIDQYYDTNIILKKDLRFLDIEKYKFLDNRLFIDDIIFNYYSKYLEDVLMMFSRMDGNKKYINTEMRINFFWELVSVWENFTEENEITTIISREIPHFPAEYILARVAERKKINFLCCEYIEHLNKTMFFNSIDRRSEPVKMKLKNDDTNFSKIIQKLSSNYENAKSPWMQKFIFNDSNKNWKNIVKSILFILPRMFYKPFCKSSILLCLNEKLTQSSRFKVYWYFLLSVLKTHKIIKYYNSIVSNNIPKKYIYFAPNYQPETTTIPDGKQYYNFVQLLRGISKVLPENFKIIYKEHPSIFKYPSSMLYRGFMCRDINYYKDLQKIKNLVFVDYKTDSFSLIDNSQFIISVKGSILLESVVRNKHAIVLGNTWHEVLDGVHRMDKIQFLNQFINDKIYMQNLSHNNIYKDLEKVSSNTVELLYLLDHKEFKNLKLKNELDLYLNYIQQWLKSSVH